MHLDDEQLQRALHDELDPHAKDAVTRHLAACEECRSRLLDAEREEAWIAERLQLVDHAPPSVDVEMLAPRARRGSVAWRWAAGILVAAAAVGTAYAWPGSPVRGWVSRATAWVAGTTREAPDRAERPPPESPEPTPEPDGAGIAVAPGERFTLHFAEAQDRGSATVSLTDGPNIVVRAVNGACTFTTGDGRLVVENAGSSADYSIELPRSAPWAEIEVDSRRLLWKQGTRIAAGVPADTHGRYVLPLSRPTL